MPFASAERPSIQLGLLSAIAAKAGFETDSHYFNLDLASQIGADTYELLCRHRGHMTGEWLFAYAAFGRFAPAAEDCYFEEFPEEEQWAEKVCNGKDFLLDLRRRVLPQFVEACYKVVEWDRYKVVGFSSTFQQNAACLALARLIKERHPEVITVFGGANMEGEMGVEAIRSFPFIDFGVSGEGDIVFPAFLQCLAEDGSVGELPGLLSRDRDGRVRGVQATPVRDLDALPTPDYRPYFDRAEALGLAEHYSENWGLPFESSRGCWWGQKHHCTFCGLNGLGMQYRAKSFERTLRELSELTSSYQICNFEAVDNILGTKYVQEFFGKIEQTKSDYEFFYEVKSNLTREHLRSLRRGGVRSIQPGIESMSTHVLELMRKGCTMLQNVRCLKWCLYYGIRVNWNLLWGFPGETEADYEKELDVLKSIGHLEPPMSCSQIWLERFSPYFTEAGKFNVRNLRPLNSYNHVYPAGVDLSSIAYFFDYEMDGTAPRGIHAATEAWVFEWRQAWYSEGRQTLTYRRTPDTLLIDFNWGPKRRGTYPLSGVLASIYELCGETMLTPKQVRQHLINSSEVDYSCEELCEAMDEFCRARLMIREGDKYLALAIPRNPNW
jgi:ribosomal peptide maturation radical SAM protein 1